MPIALGKAARLSLIPYRTRKSEKMSGNGKSRVFDLVWAGIDSRKAGQVTMSKERLFVARKGKPVPQTRFASVVRMDSAKRLDWYLKAC